MRKNKIALCCLIVMFCISVSGCDNKDNVKKDNDDVSISQEQKKLLEDGVYTADFNTDNSMFHVSEACNGKGTLTVTDEKMMLHISLASKNVVNLFQGLAQDAKKDGAKLLEPTVDTVTYSDGTTEEVNGFDIEVFVLDDEFDLALLGTKGKWYDHKVSVSNPVKKDDSKKNAAKLEDGKYLIDVSLEGGSGRATITSPATLTVKDGDASAHIEWSSPNYDYMKIENKKYDPVNTDGNSAFELPVSVFDDKIVVIADTTAMGTPHEIEYTLTFHLDSAKKE